jgi:hypothetical protein
MWHDGTTAQVFLAHRGAVCMPGASAVDGRRQAANPTAAWKGQSKGDGQAAAAAAAAAAGARVGEGGGSMSVRASLFSQGFAGESGAACIKMTAPPTARRAVLEDPRPASPEITDSGSGAQHCVAVEETLDGLDDLMLRARRVGAEVGREFLGSITAVQEAAALERTRSEEIRQVSPSTAILHRFGPKRGASSGLDISPRP